MYSLAHLQVFLRSVEKFFNERPSDVGSAVFDKDDDLAVDIVTSASNLRAICYDIPTQSVFDAKVSDNPFQFFRLICGNQALLVHL